MAATPAPLAGALWVLLLWTGVCGALMLVKFDWLTTLTRWSYTGFDVGLTLVLLVSVIALLLRLAVTVPAEPGIGKGQPVTT